MDLRLTINGSIPSKKNSRISYTRGNRVINIPSNKYREWHKDASAQLMAQGKPKQLGVCFIEIEFYADTKRKFDLTNKAESIMDLLVDNGVLEDDNCYCVQKVSLRFGGVDRERPRADIVLITS